MDISVFEVVGPVMVGPSSSHTAGAARLARVAKLIAGKPFSHVSFGLHGSFARTYKGHGTDKALVGGALGLVENDERLIHAFDMAKQQNLTYDFYETELPYMHENSVQMTFHLTDGVLFEVTGSSIGGAQIVIRRINGMLMNFSGASPTLVIQHHDKKGVISTVTNLLAENNVNIGVMEVKRNAKGRMASCIIETDQPIMPDILTQIQQLQHIISAQTLHISS